MASLDSKIRDAAQRLLRLLAEGRFQELEDLSAADYRSSAEGIRHQAEAYPGKYRCPEWEEIVYDVYPTEDPMVFVVETRAFTEEEGLTQLTIVFELVDRGDQCDVIFRDILVQ